MATTSSGPGSLERGTEYAAPRALSAIDEARAFRRLRWCVFKTLARLGLQRSRIQLITVLATSLLLWCGLFLLFFEGFSFLHSNLVQAGLRAQLVHAVFNVFFLALTVMMTFSSGIILYGALFRTEEVAFLLSTPISEARIVVYKFEETVFFGSWGFLLLGSPMLIAYGVVAAAPWYYFVLIFPFMLTFVLVPAGIGAIGCLLVVRMLPAIRVHAMAVLAALVLLAGAAGAWQVVGYENRDMMTLSWFQDVLTRLKFSEQRLLPSWWLSSGLLEAANPVETFDMPAWRESVLFLAVLLANALLLERVLRRLGARWFRFSYSTLAGLSRSRRMGRISRLDRAALWLGRPFPPVWRQLMLKDLRLFRRDLVQWSQFAIFFGLLGLYFFNVRRLDYADAMEKWVVIMSFMNVGVVGLILSTFTTRFIFPTISLEGRRLWILGTAPINRDTVLWGKLSFSCAVAFPPCCLLVLVSDVVLGIWRQSMWIALLHQLVCASLCIGLSALAVGLGARYPSFREPSPSKIAAGFGGTLNLVCSSLYIITLVLLTAVPAVAWMNAHVMIPGDQPWWWGGRFGLGSTFSLLVGVVATLALALFVTVYPLRIGLRAFRRIEV